MAVQLSMPVMWVKEPMSGLFSYYLLQGLNGEAVNSQGEVTVTGLAEYTPVSYTHLTLPTNREV